MAVAAVMYQVYVNGVLIGVMGFEAMCREILRYSMADCVEVYADSVSVSQ
jgi:hypothetical protein